MRTVSQQWKSNQNKNFVGESDIKIILDVTDPEAVADAEATANTATYYSKPEQVINDKDKTIKNYATLEQNFWCLDGTNRVLPEYNNSSPLTGIGDVGYVSGILSKADRTFENNPIITLSFSRVFSTTIPAITIIWNRLNGEYATDFKVTVLNGDDVVIAKSVTGNSSVDCIIYEDFASYDKITIEIIKWCKPISRVRLTEIDLGISKEFLKEAIISMSIQEEVDAVGASLPTNTLKFELDNSDEFFNPYNEEGFYRYLCRRQRIIAKVGYYNNVLDYMEWVQMGEFFLSNWDSPQNKITANFEANNLLSFLNNRKYIECNVGSSGTSLYDLADTLLLSAGLRKNADGSPKWILSNVLKNIITTGIIPVCTQLEALQYIAQAACCVLFCDNIGNIHIEPINEQTTDYAVNLFNSYQFPEIEVQKILGKVQVNCYTYKAASDSTELFNGILDITGDETVAIEYSTPTFDASSVSFSITGATSHSAVKYNNGCRLTLNGCSGSVTVVISGKPIETSTRIVSIVNDPNSDDEQDIDNPLITSYEHARIVGLWVKDWLTKRNQVSTEWRCDPRLNAMDIIQIENKYAAINKLRVGYVEMRYNGSFKGKLTGRLL